MAIDDTIAVAIGRSPGRESKLTKLGDSAEGQANTHRTFATAFTRADGSGYVTVDRDGSKLATISFGPEKELVRAVGFSASRGVIVKVLP